MSKFEEYAAKFSGVVSDVDLSGYHAEQVAHKVKSVDTYRLEVAELIFCGEQNEGSKLPFSGLRDNFALRKHEMTIWTGYKGHGKSAFISQVINTCLTQNETVFIISPEFRPAKVLERMIYQRYGNRDISENQLMRWFEWAEGKIWLYDVQHSLNPDDVLALCRYAVDTFGVNHILIDSLMKCGIDQDNYAKQKQFVDRLQTLCHKFPMHMHLVAHARKGGSDESIPKLHDIKGASEIADLAENVVCVWRNKAKEKEASYGSGNKMQDDPDAVVVVEAQRNAHGWVGGVNLMFNKDSMLFYERGQQFNMLEHVSEGEACPV